MKHTQERIENIKKGKALRFPNGQIPWNKGLTNIYSKETRLKMGKGRKGKPGVFLGKKHTEESKEKVRKTLQERYPNGRTPWNKGTKGVMVAWNKGKEYGEETRQKIREANLGKKYSLDVREKHRKYWMGEKNPNYKNGQSKYLVTHYKDFRHRLWRETIFLRDDYTCQDCRKRGGYLEAHHIKSYANYPESRYDLDNGITLCKKCHRQTGNYRHKGIIKNYNKNKPIIIVKTK